MELFLSIAAILVCGIIILKMNSTQAPPRALCFICEIPLEKVFYCQERSFCYKHLEDYQYKEWAVLFQGGASSKSPEFGVKMYELRESLVRSGLPSFIESSYQMNGDEIQTQMKLMILKSDLERAQALSKLFES